MRGRWLFPAVGLLALFAAGSAAGRAGLDRYGGWTGAQLPASGWFRTQKLDGRWWLVDPEGHPFRSAGVEGVSTATGAGGARDPYRAAISQKYGGLSAWAERAAQQLSTWGFNTVGAGSDDRICHQGLPYLLLLGLSGRPGRRAPSVDVFSPRCATGRAASRRLCAAAQATNCSSATSWTTASLGRGCRAQRRVRVPGLEDRAPGGWRWWTSWRATT
jgi:hypothetical protein